MGWLLSKVYDPIMASSERACLQAWRAELFSDLQGSVLEIGAGTGSSLEHYPEGLAQLVLAEPDRHMRTRLSRRLPQRLRAITELSDAGAEQLPFPDATFDAIVSSLVLCTVPDLELALAEIHRVLARGGRLVFLEHVADDKPHRLKWQRRLEPLWKQVAGGCHLTRRTAEAIERAGFTLEGVTRESVRKANPLTRCSVRGVAIKA